MMIVATTAPIVMPTTIAVLGLGSSVSEDKVDTVVWRLFDSVVVGFAVHEKSEIKTKTKADKSYIHLHVYITEYSQHIKSINGI